MTVGWSFKRHPTQVQILHPTQVQILHLHPNFLG